jgi:hypothetical protein
MKEMTAVIEITEIREMIEKEESSMIEETETRVKSDNINPILNLKSNEELS